MIQWREDVRYPKLPPFFSSFVLVSENTGDVTYEVRQNRKQRAQYSVYVRAGFVAAHSMRVRDYNVSGFVRQRPHMIMTKDDALQWCEADFVQRSAGNMQPRRLSLRARKAFNVAD